MSEADHNHEGPWVTITLFIVGLLALSYGAFLWQWIESDNDFDERITKLEQMACPTPKEYVQDGDGKWLCVRLPQ